MYSCYVEVQGWKMEIIEVSYIELGGYKEIIFMINGKGVFVKLKFENGVYCV